jgi:hypothetical protein
MKKFVALAVIALAAVALYATAAPAGQQAVTPGQFNALKSRVAKVEKRAANLENVLNACFTAAFPVTRYGGYVYQDSGGNVFLTTALDLTQQGGTVNAYSLDVGPECANAINSTAGFHHFRIATSFATAFKRH